MVNKPLSSTEMKILIYNKVKKGMSYEDARKELAMEIGEVKKNSKKVKSNE